MIIEITEDIKVTGMIEMPILVVGGCPANDKRKSQNKNIAKKTNDIDNNFFIVSIYPCTPNGWAKGRALARPGPWAICYVRDSRITMYGKHNAVDT